MKDYFQKKKTLYGRVFICMWDSNWLAAWVLAFSLHCWAWHAKKNKQKNKHRVPVLELEVRSEIHTSIEPQGGHLKVGWRLGSSLIQTVSDLHRELRCPFPGFAQFNIDQLMVFLLVHGNASPVRLHGDWLADVEDKVQVVDCWRGLKLARFQFTRSCFWHEKNLMLFFMTWKIIYGHLQV